MLAPGWARLLAAALPLLIGCGALLGALAYTMGAPPPAAPDAMLRSLAIPAPPSLLVEVTGAVGHPGLYRLQRGDRLYAAIATAGGVEAGADPNRLPDLAARLRDGQQVKVPFVRGSAAAAKTDLNSATVQELSQVPGFTPDLASAAVTYRDEYGGFASSKELVSVLGMGAADYLLAKPHLRP